jgi:hypothetical protein
MTEKTALIKIAQTHGWNRCRSEEPYMISFDKVINDNRCRVNIYWKKRSSFYTVSAQCGELQKFRKHVDVSAIESIFLNPL